MSLSLWKKSEIGGGGGIRAKFRPDLRSLHLRGGILFLHCRKHEKPIAISSRCHRVNNLITQSQSPESDKILECTK